MEINRETIEDYIPYYLTQEQKNNLIRALEGFPDNFMYYTRLYPDEILQGDGWNSFELIEYSSRTLCNVRGIILSNSCDIDPDNERDLPVNIVFAPIIPLSSYIEVLENSGISRTEIDSKLDAIRKQHVYTLFYLPQGMGLDDEYIALLDDIHSMPLAVFLEKSEKIKLFTLSTSGFYLFLLKLSIRFCRFREEISRN
ncbi:MAG: hypothetical protein PHU03_00075 [Syntrophales bacterium]|nr:hypothetical protein [Syntrophales bacterium]